MTRERYDIPDPKCNHAASKRIVRVSAGDPTDILQAFASVRVCARQDCIEDATDWVKAITRREPAVYHPGAQ
jgi:hypothetical protein